MDASVETKVNALDEELRKNIEDIDKCSKDIGSALQTHAQKIKEWGETVMEMDKKLSSMSEAYLAALLDDLEYEKQREHDGQAKVLAKQEEAKRLQMQYARSREEFESEAAREKEIANILEDLQTTIAHDKQRIETRKKAVPHPCQQISIALTQAEDRIRNSENTMLHSIELMQTMLGLRLTAIEDRSLLLTFTCLDPSDPEAEFRVTIVSEEGRYRGMSNSVTFLKQPVRLTNMFLDSGQQIPDIVSLFYQTLAIGYASAVDCVPQVPHFEHLEEALSMKDLSLPKFIIKMRKAFESHILE